MTASSPAASTPVDRRRFALVAPNYYPLTCGVGDHSMRLAAELRRRGHEAVVFTHEPAAPNPADPTVPVRSVKGRRPFSIAARVVRAIVTGGFSDVVIQYTPQMWGAQRFGSPAIPYLAALLRRRGLRIVLVMHEAATPWNARPDLALGAALLRVQLAAVISASHVRFVTTESRREMIRHATRALPSPISPQVLRVGAGAVPEPATFTPGRHRLGLFSTLTVGKSFELVVGAFERILNRYPDAELLLLGDLGPPQNPRRRALESRIASSPGADRIRVTGKLPLVEVAAAVSSLDVYLFPMNTGANTRSSTLPLALGAGVPVVAIRGVETDSIFEHGRNIFFADDLNDEAFARAALELFGDPALATRVAVGQRELYARALSWEKIGDTFLEAVR